MESRQKTLDSLWQSLQKLPRMKLNELFVKLGLAKSMYAKLKDQEAKKLFLGLATRLDDAALNQMVLLLRA